ncbi:MAG: hypothetical protein ABI877_22470 [Gemmatimonadaceae bacterium]
MQSGIPSTPRTTASNQCSRWFGVALLMLATAYLLAMGTLRERFNGVPNLVWGAVLVVLLVVGGARSAHVLSESSSRLKRHVRIARMAALLSLMALVFGVMSIRATAAEWTDDARALGALALCIALVGFPFGVALLRRTDRLTQEQLTVVAKRDRWLATAYPPRHGTSGDDIH